jgi:hypothetical protein
MTLKVWSLNKWASDPSCTQAEGPLTYPVEVVEKAEYDKLRGALEEINDLIPHQEGARCQYTQQLRGRRTRTTHTQ